MAKNSMIHLVILLCMTSCYYNRNMVYLNDESFSENRAKHVKNERPQYRIQCNDILSVKVKSATDATISDIFNIAQNQGNMFMGPQSLYLEGYSVNDDGNIHLPILGDVMVRNLTLEEVQLVVQENATKYLHKSTVIVKLISFKITVLGEVNNPGNHYVFNNQATVLEALGLAGDLTKVGNRQNVKLIRQHPGGSEVILLNLADPKLLESDYFFLMPNDVLYVEPLRATINRSNLDLLSVLFSAATTAILILNYTSNN